jgi:hypothetical protein
MPEEVLKLLIQIHPDAMTCKDSKQRTPFQCALESVGNSSNGPATIKYLLDDDKTLVNTKCSNGKHPLTFLQQGYGSISKNGKKRARYSDSLKCILGANPDQNLGFFRALENLDNFLQEDVFIHTLEDEKLSKCRKHIQMDIFFTTFRPKTFQSVMIRSLESNNSKECMDWMNKQSCKRSVVFFLMIQLYMHCLWIGKLSLHQEKGYLVTLLVCSRCPSLMLNMDRPVR